MTEATPEQQRAWSRGNSLTALSILSVLVGAIATVATYLATTSIAAALVPAGIVTLVVAATRGYRGRAVFQSAAALHDRIENEMPSVVLTLERPGLRD